MYEHIESKRNEPSGISDLPLSLVSGREEKLRAMASELYHVLVMLTRGRAQKLVLKAGDPEGFEAYRLLLRRYELQTTAATVTKLVELLSTQFAGDLLDCVTDFETRVAVWGSEAGEQLSDLIKIGFVVKGLEKGNFRDHLLINTSGTKQWSRFIKEIEAVELARLNSRPTPMDLSAVGHDQPKRFEGNCSWCGTYGNMDRDCWRKAAAQSQSSKGPQSWNTSQWSQWGDRGGGKDHGKGKGKGKSKSKGKGKGKKGSKGLHEMEDQSSEQEGYSQEWYASQNVWYEDSGPGGTELHEGQWDSHDQNSTSWETPNEWTSTASSSQQAAPNTGGSIQMLGGLDLCAVEKCDRNTMKTTNVRTDQSNRKITFGVDTAACRTVVPGNHPAARGYRVHWDSEAGVPYSIAGKSNGLGRRSTSVGGKAGDGRNDYDRVTTGDGATTTVGRETDDRAGVNGCALVQTEPLRTRLKRAE